MEVLRRPQPLHVREPTEEVTTPVRQLIALAPTASAGMATGGAFTANASEFLDRVPNVRLDNPFDSTTLLGLVRALVR